MSFSVRYFSNVREVNARFFTKTTHKSGCFRFHEVYDLICFRVAFHNAAYVHDRPIFKVAKAYSVTKDLLHSWFFSYDGCYDHIFFRVAFHDAVWCLDLRLF